MTDPPTPRRRRVSQALIALLLAVLGFGLALQVRSTSADSGLRTARQSDLVRILDDLSQRGRRLADEEQALQATREQLLSGADKAATALQDARERADTLGILAGTVPATGPGIRLTIQDPKRAVKSFELLDALQELRDAGAEAVQIGPVRAVASTYLTQEGDRIFVDGVGLDPPYQILAIGDPPTLASALDIPGGVLEVLRRDGARGEVTQLDRVVIDALRPLSTPQYARPAPEPAATPK